jgi:RNA polymerase sigma factor (sigma-70 family)
MPSIVGVMAGSEPDTWMGGAQREFVTTLWTVVVRAKDPTSPERREALQKLIETYWKPLYHFVRRRGQDQDRAKDTVQSFFATLMEKDLLKFVQPSRGRFRTFLLLAMKSHVSSVKEHDTALKRGGGKPLFSLDFEAAEQEIEDKSSDESPDQVYRREWALRVLKQALDSLRSKFEEEGRREEFEAVKLHLGAGSGERRSYAEIGTTLGLSEDEVRKRIHRARTLYREEIIGIIRAYTENESEVHEELDDLLSAFR